MKIILVCGARPNFMKIAPLMRAASAVGGGVIEPLLVHTGQHYDDRMNRWFFEELEIPRPEINLEVGSGSHAVQTAEVMKRFEPVVVKERPAAVLVVGDVNSTVACALVASKLNVPVIHVEAGLRSFDRTMPEEINRVVCDALSELLFVTEPSGVANLRAEGKDGAEAGVHLVGNVMIDTLRRFEARAAESDVLERLGLEQRGYAALTLHRPSNVDDAATFGRIVEALAEIQERMRIVFPMHPRTRGNLESTANGRRLAGLGNVSIVDPLGYLDFLKLMSQAACVMTDSGGIQEETTILGVPCLTLRANTERPVTVEQGTNRLVGSDPGRIVEGFRQAVGNPVRPCVPELWDGRAAERIVGVIGSWGQESKIHS